MPTRERVYLPELFSITGTIAGNPVFKLKHAGHVEAVDVETYNKHGVTGWTLRRSSGENVLVVPRKTSARPCDSVLVLPEIASLPKTRSELPEGWRWIAPKPNSQIDAALMPSVCAEVRTSWSEAFHFVEEQRDGDHVLRPGLRPPQMGALYAALAHWKVTKELGTIVMPTGTGKTETMLALLARERPKCLLAIVPTAALREQVAWKFITFGVLQEFGVISDTAELPVVGKLEHKFGSKEEAELFLQGCNVVVATMQVVSQCSYAVQRTLANGCSHLFIDEAHHSAASTWNHFRELAREQGKPVLQFTATPFRRDGKHVGGKMIFTYPLRKAQEERYFTPITFVSVWQYNRDLADATIARRALQSLREDLAAEHDHLLMARTENIVRAKRVHEIYANLAPDLNPLIVHSELKEGERTAALQALRTRQSRAIVCVDMLGEGFDLPQLKVAALHDIHKSLTVTIQFAGRFTRTATGIGTATVVANAADADVEEALEDLYAKDSDWNQVLRRLSEGATGHQQIRSDFLDGFQNAPAGIPLQNIYPKMSTVVYKTKCANWSPSAVKYLLGESNLLVEPTVNPQKRVLLYITREQLPVAWGQTKSVQDVVHDLYLAHWDEDQELLFINSTNNNGMHQALAKALAGEDVELIRGEKVYRCLYGLNRLILSNLGLTHLLSRATQFSMYMGSDLKEGLTNAAVANRTKSNLFSRGYEGGESVTLGASHKGRIWSHRIAEDVSEWGEWCKRIGAKLLDNTISTDKILESAIIPEEVKERPNLVPLTIEWPPYFLERSDEAVHVEVGGKSAPFYEADLEITTFSDTGPLRFRVAIGEAEAEYEVAFKGKVVEYLPLTQSEAYLSASGRRMTLTDWFQEECPSITFEDSSKLEYNEIYRPKTERVPFDPGKIERWDWSGVVLTKESQYKSHKSPPRLEFRPDSIQRRVIVQLLGGYGAEFDVIFDDDSAGEIADIVALRAAGDNLLVQLFHCKYSKADEAGARVGDCYEVCGQAQKSVYWRGDVKGLFERLQLREMERQKKYGESRFVKGDLQKLEELRRRSRVLRPEFRIYIVQPGINAAEVDTPMLDLLGATELYLRETFEVPLTVIGS